MKSSLKKFLKVNALVLCLVMLFSVIPFATFAVNPPTSEQYTVTVAGGTAAFANKAEAFTGTATDGDVVTVTYTEVAGRTFKCWKTDTGATIYDKSFSFMVSCDTYFYVVFTDSDDYEYSEPVAITDVVCEGGTVYKSENTAGDVQYTLNTDSWHEYDYDNAVFLDTTYHNLVCKNCGQTYKLAHNFIEEDSRDATHAEEGYTTYVCTYCGYEYTVYSPKLDAPHEMGNYQIFQESANGEYGIRMAKCEYCDYTETCWYLDTSLKPILKNHYVHFISTSNMVGKSKEEWFFSYTEDDGTVVYIYFTQYTSMGGYTDNRASYLLRFYDDENPETLKPVYITATPNNCGVTNGHFGYVKTFEEWIDCIDDLSDLAGYHGNRTIGNLMDVRSSSFVGFSYSWANEFNNYMIPISEDPDEWIAANTTWTNTAELIAQNSIITDPETYESAYIGGIATTLYTRPLTNDGRSLLYYVADGSGSLVEYYDSVAGNGTHHYIDKYKEIVTSEEYETMTDLQKANSISINSISSIIKAATTSGTRNELTMSPDRPTSFQAFRIMCPVGYDHFSFSTEGYYDYSSYNPARMIPSHYKVTVQYKESDGEEFVRWDKWNFEEEKWEVFSTEKEFTFGGESNRTTEAIYLACITKDVEPVLCHVTISDGASFCIADEYHTYYTEADLPVGTVIVPYTDYAPEGKEHDYWLINGTWIQNGYMIEIEEDTDISDVYKDIEYSVSFETSYINDAQRGQVSLDGVNYEFSVGASGILGTELTVTTQPSDSDYTIFLGWYLRTYDKDGEKYILLSSDTTLSYTIEGWLSGQICAIWSDGNVSLEPKMIHVSVINGYASSINMKGSDSKTYILSSFGAESWSTVLMYDDPIDNLNTIGWTLEYTDSSGKAVSEDYMLSPRSYSFPVIEVCLPGLDNMTGNSVTVTAITAQSCPDGNHINMSETRYVEYPDHITPGISVSICLDCGETIYEDVPALVDSHYYDEYTKSYKDETYHEYFCECGDSILEEHSWDCGHDYPAEHLIRFTCAECHATLDVPYDAPALELKPESEPILEMLNDTPVLNDVAAGTTSEELKEMFNNITTVVVDKDGNELGAGDKVGTGSKIMLIDAGGNVIDEATVIVPGDTDGDGNISAKDALIALKQSVGLIPLDDIYVAAGDISDTGSISSIDALNILRISSGLAPIAP